MDRLKKLNYADPDALLLKKLNNIDGHIFNDIYK